jgi:hypothetical protein
MMDKWIFAPDFRSTGSSSSLPTCRIISSLALSGIIYREGGFTSSPLKKNLVTLSSKVF